MTETGGDRERAETITYYLLMEMDGEDTADKIQASAHFGPLVDDMLVRLQAGDDTDQLKAFLLTKVDELPSGTNEHAGD